MNDYLWFVILFIIFFCPWGRIWDKLLGKEKEEEKEMAYPIEPGSCEEESLLNAKLECLRLAHSMINHETTTTDTIIANATKFWNFLTAEELPEFPSESGH